MKLKDQVALITGGSRGIGRAIALAFAREGARVAINFAANREAAEKTAEEIKTIYSAVGAIHESPLLLQGDIADSAQVDTCFAELKKTWGRLDILVNNAGVIKDGFLMLMSEKDWDRVINTNLKGNYLCSRAALRLMINQKSGNIINMISPSALTGRAGQGNYSASKGGVLSLTKTLAREVAQFGIRVNALSPGVIETELVEQLKPEVQEELLKMIPLGRFGRVEEVGQAAVFLASADSNYITGQVLSIDGGLVI